MYKGFGRDVFVLFVIIVAVLLNARRLESVFNRFFGKDQAPTTYMASISSSQDDQVGTDKFLGLLCDHDDGQVCKTTYVLPDSNGYTVTFVSATSQQMTILAGYSGDTMATYTINLNEGLWYGGENSVQLVLRQPSADPANPQPLVAEAYLLK